MYGDAARAANRRSSPAGVHSERMSELILVVSELASDAWLHGRGRIVLRLQVDEKVLGGDVITQGPASSAR
jgi:hypothetical protein